MRAICHVCSVRVFVALAFLLAASGERPARAQDAPRPGNDELWTAPGHWAMQFRVGQNFTLENFQGSFLSAQRWWSSRNALRFGVSLAFDAQDYSLGGMDQDTDTSRQSFSAAVQYIRYFAGDGPVRALVGAGPGGSLLRQHTEQRSGSMMEERTSRTWTAGVDGLLGTEWRCLQWLTLLAEYNWTMSYRSATDSTEPVSMRPTVKAFQFAATGARFGVAAHF